MIKKSYINKRLSQKHKLEELLTPPSASEGLSSDSSKGVGRGLVMPGEPVQPPHSKDSEEENLLVGYEKNQSRIANPHELMELFSDIGDALDDEGLHSEADFIDFLIVKFAEIKNPNYSLMFKNLLIKIIKSDLINNQDIAKHIVKNYNSVLKNKISENLNKKEAEKIAYESSINMANKYVTNPN